MNFKYLMRFRYYRKIMLTFLVIGILTISVSIIGLTMIYDRIVTKQVGSISASLLKHDAEVFENLMNNCQKACETLIMGKNFPTVAEGEKVSQVDEYKVMQEIYKIKSTYPYILHMGVLNGRLNRYVGTRGIYFDDEKEIKSCLPESGRFALVTRMVSSYENTPKAPKLQVFSYIYEPYNYQNIDSCIVIDMDYEKIAELFNIQEQLKEGSVFLFMDDNENVVFYTVDGEKTTLSYVESLMNKSNYRQENGYELVRQGIFSPKYLLAYYKIEYIPWTMVRVMPYESISGDFVEIRLIFSVLIIVAIALYFMLCLLGFRYIYNKKHNHKEHREKYRLSNQERYAVLGEDMNRETTYCTIVFCERESRLDAEASTDMYSLYFSIQHVLNELFGQDNSVTKSAAWRKEIALVCHLPDGHIRSGIRMAIEELVIRIKEEYNIQLIAGCSRIFVGEEQLMESLYDARKAAMQKVIQNHKYIFFAEELSEKDNIIYPGEIEKKILESLSKGEKEQAEELTNQFFDAVEMSHQGQKLIGYIQRLFLQTCYRGDILTNHRMYEFFQEVINGENAVFSNDVEKLRRNYKKLCSWILEKKQTVQKGSDDPIGYIVQYIDNNFANPEITITYLADLVNLSSAYLGQLFSKTMGMNCNEYLLQTRMQMAEKMLTETELSIQAISEKVGILNSNYFYTLFRKKYGVTPLQYRKAKKGLDRKE